MQTRSRYMSITGFNPRSRTGSDVFRSRRFPSRRVSIHAPARGATSRPVKTCALEMFQSTLPHGERHLSTRRFGHARGFNPRSRTGSDPCADERGRERMVSIHAPARGATFDPIHPVGFGDVSIHAPARGATFVKILSLGDVAFQSTLPHGERHSRRSASAVRRVSIHAPARGATATRPRARAFRTSFNPRSRTGSDTRRNRGEKETVRFNPRSRTGSDCISSTPK